MQLRSMICCRGSRSRPRRALRLRLWPRPATNASRFLAMNGPARSSRWIRPTCIRATTPITSSPSTTGCSTSTTISRPFPNSRPNGRCPPTVSTWTFKLREGVKFHSGKDFTSADVVYTFKRFFDAEARLGRQGGSRVPRSRRHQGRRQYTVSFTTKKPVVELPVLITNKFTNIVPEGAKHEDLRLKADGTGPFMQEQFMPNDPVRILRKNPNYWDAGKPKAECLRITVAQEPVAAVTAIKAGQVDLVLNVDPTGIPTLKDDPNVELLETGASNSMTMSMWVDTAALRQRQGAPGARSRCRPPGDDRYGAAGLRRARRRQSGAAREPGLLHQGGAEAGYRGGQEASRRGRPCRRPEIRPLHRRRRAGHGAAWPRSSPKWPSPPASTSTSS